MSKSGKILIGIIAAVTLLGFVAPSDYINGAEVADQIADGIWPVVDEADEVTAPIKEAAREAKLEAERERLRELGYPDGYDPNNPVANGEFTQEDWEAIQQEEAMRSLAEDAMNDYYQPDPDETWGFPF